MEHTNLTEMGNKYITKILTLQVKKYKYNLQYYFSFSQRLVINSVHTCTKNFQKGNSLISIIIKSFP